MSGRRARARNAEVSPYSNASLTLFEHKLVPIQLKYNWYSHRMEKSRATVCSLALFYSSPLLLTGTFVAVTLLPGTRVDVALLLIGLATLLGVWTGMPLGFS